MLSVSCLFDNIFMKLSSKLYIIFLGILIDTNCDPIVVDLFCLFVCLQ